MVLNEEGGGLVWRGREVVLDEEGGMVVLDEEGGVLDEVGGVLDEEGREVLYEEGGGRGLGGRGSLGWRGRSRMKREGLEWKGRGVLDEDEEGESWMQRGWFSWMQRGGGFLGLSMFYLSINWTIPSWIAGLKFYTCFIKINIWSQLRYNMTSWICNYRKSKKLDK